MSMPGGIEMARHYTSRGAFERDQSEMERHGWTLESYHMEDRAGGLLAMLGLHRQTVDAHYLRPDFPLDTL